MTTREVIARAIEARADELDRDPGPYLRVDQVQLSAGLRWAARIAREVGDDTAPEDQEQAEPEPDMTGEDVRATSGIFHFPARVMTDIDPFLYGRP